MSDFETTGKQKRVALCVGGGIAAYKAVEVLRGLQKADCKVLVAMTAHATEFVQPLTFRALTGEYVLVDDYEKENPDPIAHINFAQNTDLFLVAPATANLIAKFANGISDDFVSTAYLATDAPVLIAPAMNTNMLLHRATQRNLETLKNDGVLFVEPGAGEMACKTVGPGRLSEPTQIVEAALRILRTSNQKSETLNLDLQGEKILITVGATREEIDPVRFISNYSTGKMGFAIAAAASARGAAVTVVAGVTNAAAPPGVRVATAVSASEMHQAVLRELENATVFVGTAAVADYRPKQREPQKIKKNADSYVLELEKNADILADVANKRHKNLLVVGFAAETTNVLEHARRKLIEKNLDLIVANDVSQTDSGFGADTNRISVWQRGESEPREFPLLSKNQAANEILNLIREARKSLAAK